MGSKSSKLPLQPSKKEFDKEWRKTNWSKGKRDAMVDALRNFNLNDPEVGHLRCLLLGPVGAGKSSFINSVNTIFQGRVAHSALTTDCSSTSFTKTYKTYYITVGTNRLPFAFNDAMGLEDDIRIDIGKDTPRGILHNDIINALKGHLPENYVFNPYSALSDKSEQYKRSPKLSDKVHCLVYVIPANKLSIMSKDVIKKMKEVREIASEMGIPQVVVMTMADMACDLVEKDLQKVYFSTALVKSIERCSIELGVPLNCILPVKNYHMEIDLDNDMDILILTAMTQIMNFANDYIGLLKQK
ncbi:hypothetical protein UPYG_G00161010 [Umbra pygmaea]|uniref:G domain-containing protein n=1 Tax=Umbra pygmaea TaxID=75934 RepID=A0ABD0WRB7_UMBPY